MEEILAEVGRLVGPMLQRRLYVCVSEPVGPPEPDAELALLPEHLRHLVAWEQSGVLFAAGPFLEDGEPGRRALYIVRAGSADEARALLSGEPYHKRGMRTFTVEEWSLNEGRVSLHVDFSSQHGGLDGHTG